MELPLSSGAGFAQETLIYLSLVTVGSETGTSVGIDGTPARMINPVLDREVLWVVMTCT